MSSMTTIDVILALQILRLLLITETNTPPFSLQLDGDFFLHLRGDFDSKSSQVHLRGDIDSNSSQVVNLGTLFCGK